MKDSSKTKEKVLIITGLLFISAGILCNEWFLAALFSSDGMIAFSHTIVIWAVNLYLVTIGFILIMYRRSLTKESMFLIAGLLFISAGILLNERVLYIFLRFPLSNANKIIIRAFDLYLMSAGIMVILYRKAIELKKVSLFGFSSLLCFTLFLSYDFYQAYLLITPLRRSDMRAQIHNVHVKDDYLGWKPKPGSIGRHKSKGNFDVTYEIDQNGFKKINNAETPDISMYFFGDSLTFGFGVNNKDTFPNIIKDKYLRKEINIYNAGVMGYGITQMFQHFSDVEDRIRPGDLVIFTPISDDIRRNIKDFLVPYLYIFFDSVPAGNYPDFDNGVIKYHKLKINLYSKLKVLALGAPYTGNFWRSINRKFIADTTKESIDMMKIIKHKTEMKGGRFILFFLPEIWECLQGSYSVDISGFNYFDIMHFFPSQKEELDKLKFDDGHWNVKGHEIVARAIVKTLIDERIINKKYLRPNFGG